MGAAGAQPGCRRRAGAAALLPARRGARRRALHDLAPDLPLVDREPLVEHGPADGGGDGALRADRNGRGVVRRANRPAGTADLGRARGGAARDPGLRGELRLGLAEHLGAGIPRRGAGDDPGGVSAGLPAGRRELPRRRPRPGGGGAQPRRRAPTDVLADHARAGPGSAPRWLPARRARAARRVRRV